MNDQNTPFISPTKRQPSNKGKFSGAKPPLRPKHVWSIRSNLQAEGRTRDLAMFNPAIDSKLRACDVVTLKVEDIAPNGYAADRAVDLDPVRGSPRPAAWREVRFRSGTDIEPHPSDFRFTLKADVS